MKWLSIQQELSGLQRLLRALPVERGLPWTPGLAVWPGRAAGRGHSGHCPDYTAQPLALHPRCSPGPLTASLSAGAWGRKGSEIQLLGTELLPGSGKERDSRVRDHKAWQWGQRSERCWLKPYLHDDLQCVQNHQAGLGCQVPVHQGLMFHLILGPGGDGKGLGAELSAPALAALGAPVLWKLV